MPAQTDVLRSVWEGFHAAATDAAEATIVTTCGRRRCESCSHAGDCQGGRSTTTLRPSHAPWLPPTPLGATVRATGVGAVAGEAAADEEVSWFHTGHDSGIERGRQRGSGSRGLQERLVAFPVIKKAQQCSCREENRWGTSLHYQGAKIITLKVGRPGGVVATVGEPPPGSPFGHL